MLRTVFRRPSPAAIIALLVLVVIAAPLANAAEEAVRGTDARSAAAKKKKKPKPVDRAKLADKAKFADNAGKVRGYSVGFAALPSRLVLTGPNGKLPTAVIPEGTGTPGPQGPAGPPGAAGAAGGFSQTRIVFVLGSRSTNGVADATVACAANERITGGGHEVVEPSRTGQAPAVEGGVVEVRHSEPVPNPNRPAPAGGSSGWYVQVVRVPPEVKFVNGVAQPNSEPSVLDKIVRVKAWAVCVSR